MPRTKANEHGVELEYDSFGDPEDPTLLLVMGLGSQMTSWRAGFCGLLAELGFHVVRFDNRDAGLSTFLDGGPQPDLRAILHGDVSSAPYLIGDMARDAVSLLDELGVERAHLVGVSMGGMIVQQLVLDHPERVSSLCSIMSRPGDGRSGNSTSEAGRMLLSPQPADRAAAIEAGVRTHRTFGSPDYPEAEAELHARIAAAYDRSNRRDGFSRQFAAVVASPDRTPGLRRVIAPTLVIHGMADPLIDPSGGEATARAVPDAGLLLIPGMGHDLPQALWPTITTAVAENAFSADGGHRGW